MKVIAIICFTVWTVCTEKILTDYVLQYDANQFVQRQLSRRALASALYQGRQTMKAITSTLTILSTIFLFGACATAPRTYRAPDSAKLEASTAKVAKAVDQAHASARKAQSAVGDVRKRQTEISTEIRKVKDVPLSLIEKVNAQDGALEQAAQAQDELETHLKEADLAKAQVAKDKAEYYGAAKKIADSATDERTKRIKDEKALSWYRWHWWGSWIALGLGVLACGVFVFLKLTGRLAIFGTEVVSKIP